MGRLIELGRTLRDGMAGINPRYAVRVRPFAPRATGAEADDAPASFEISEVAFQVPVGTYIDAPRTRDAGGRDIAALGLDELILPGLYLDCRAHGQRAHAAVVPADLPPASAIAGRAVLFDFGRASFYGTPSYDETPPFLPRATVEALLAAGAKLVGVDCRSPDDPRDPTRPAHTLLLRAGTLIVENLAGLEALGGRRFRFFAIPVRVEGATSFPVRAFAEILD